MAKPNASADETLVEEAHKEFKACEDREAYTRPLWKADLRFANGDPDNGYQWDEALRKQRELDMRPCLTTNKVKQHNRQITNDARQNKPSIRTYPVDGGADKKTAEIFNGIIRHIEANSNADTAYDIAGEFAVDAGLGYWRVTTDYVSDDSFDQEIYIKAVPNPLNVYLGKHSEPDGSDAKCGFVFEDMAKTEFERRFPKADPVGWPLEGGSEWLTKETIRVAEYWKIVEEADTLYALPDGPVLLSKMDAQTAEVVRAAGDAIDKREVFTRKCKWYLIAGDKILDRRDWLGKYIPIVRVVGEEIEIDGKVDRKGHTRAMKDAQRMYNYWSSAGVEYGALQGKQPYLAPVEAVAGHEKYWDNLNTSNLPYLPYNSKDPQGGDVPMPQRQMPPVTAPMYMEGMRVASEEMKMASGQYDASMGAKSNETSGRAIMARQREGDNATFHFIDNVARAIRYTGKILIDLIPKVYDTARVVRILGEDGSDDMVEIDPKAPQAVQQQRDEETGAIKEIYNPSVGRYDVVVAVGPSYGTKRQEAFQALTEMSSRNPQLMQVAGDLVMKAADFPMAQEIAERLEKTLPPGLMEPKDGEQEIPPQVQAELQAKDQQIQQMGEALNNASEMVDQLEAKTKDDSVKAFEAENKANAEAARIRLEERKLAIEEFRAETERIKALADIEAAERAQTQAETSAAMEAEQAEPQPA
jgi:hypothetical protein